MLEGQSRAEDADFGLVF